MVTTISSNYHELYAPLPPMKKGSHRHMFGDGVGKHKMPLVRRGGLQTLPHWYSDSPLNLDFLRKLVDSFNEAMPVDMDSDGFTVSGVFSRFDRLKSVAGYFSSPMSYVPIDNALLLQSLNLSETMTEDEKEIGRELWDVIWSSYLPSTIKITKRSAGGARRNTSDHEWKKAYGRYVLQPTILERILTAHAARDWLTLANEYEMLFLMESQKRGQPDDPSKKRVVMDFDYAVTGGKQGHAIHADKSITIDGVPQPDFSAMRSRFVHAGPWSINVCLSMIYTGTLQAMFKNFPKTWHVNDAETLKSIADGHYVFASDVTEYDRSMKREHITIPHEVGKKYWDERLMDMSEHLFFSAYYAKPLVLADQDISGFPHHGVIVGDYTSFDPQVVCGNRSGHAGTSVFSKVNKVWETLYAFHKLGHKVKGHVKEYLEHKMIWKIINNGDDTNELCAEKEVFQRYVNARKDPAFGSFAVKREDGAVTSGLVLRKDPAIPLTYHPCPRVAVPFEKIYCPERPITDRMRRYWWVGVEQRINDRDSCPAAGTAWECHDRLYHTMVAPHIGSLYSLLAEAEARDSLPVPDATPSENAVLEEPSRLYHKGYADGTIRQAVLDAVTTGIQTDDFIDTVETYYRGNILEKEKIHD